MIDGIKLSTAIPNAAQWLRLTAACGIEFTAAINTETGEERERVYAQKTTLLKWANWKGYKLIMRTTTPHAGGGPPRYRLELRGSLHKSHYGGKNFAPFSFEQLLQEIAYIENGLHLPADCWKIDNIEIGVNIRPPFEEPAHFINLHLLMQGTKEFRFYKKVEGVQIGKHTEGTEHFLKVYDKGLQEHLREPLLRVELHCSKMRPLEKSGIKTLADLRDLSRLKALLAPLLAAWDKVLLMEPTTAAMAAKLALMKRKEQHLHEFAQHRKNWIELQHKNKDSFKDKRKDWYSLRGQLGHTCKEEISRRIAAEWERLAQPAPQRAPSFPLPAKEAFPPFSPLR